MSNPYRSVVIFAGVVALGLTLVLTAATQNSKNGVFQPAPPGLGRGATESQASETGTPKKNVRTKFSRISGHLPGKTLLQMLESNDKDVEIVSESFHDSRDTLDPIAELEQLTQSSSAVVVVKATAILGTLENGGRTIASTLHGGVLEVVKNATAVALSVGQDLPLTIRDGGEILVDGRRVGYRKSYAVMPVVGGVYLFFLFEEEGRLHLQGLDTTFELTEGKIRRMHQDGEWGLGGTVDAMTSLTIVRNAATKPANR